MYLLYPPSVTRHLHEHDVAVLAAAVPTRQRNLAGVAPRFLTALRLRHLDEAADCAVSDCAAAGRA